MRYQNNAASLRSPKERANQNVNVNENESTLSYRMSNTLDLALHKQQTEYYTYVQRLQTDLIRSDYDKFC